MVTSPGGSRPAALTQRQVDDLVRGDHGEVARVLRPAGESPGAARRSTETGGRPVDLSAGDVDAIRRSGTAPGRLAKRIAAVDRPATRARRTPKTKGGAARTKRTSPTVPPPSY